MEPILQSIIQELQSMLDKAKNLQTNYMGEILALQKVVNQAHKTNPQIVKKQIIQKEQIKQEITKEEVENKVDAFLSEIDMMQKNIESDPRPKYEVKPPDIVVEKKPPIPTINRNEKSNKTAFTAYVPPKNRNQVTGKVTQTTVKTSAQKVFKPQLTGMKRSGSKEITTNKNSTIKNRQPVDIKIERKQETHQVKAEQHPKVMPLKKVEQPQKIEKASDKNSFQENTRVKLQTFNKPVDELLQELSSKGQKNRKVILQKMIRQFEAQEVGHKKHEESSRTTFIKHSCNYSISRNQVHPVITHKIQRAKWRYYPQIFELRHLLQNLDTQVKNLQSLKQYRMDPRQQYKICQTALKLSQVLERVDEDKIIVPDQLALNFSFSEAATPSESLEDKDVNIINTMKVNEGLIKLLENISESETLQKQELRGLQILAEVGVYRSKKSPVLVTEDEFQGWSEHYFSEY